MWSATIGRRFSVVTSTNNRKNLATICMALANCFLSISDKLNLGVVTDWIICCRFKIALNGKANEIPIPLTFHKPKCERLLFLVLNFSLFTSMSSGDYRWPSGNARIPKSTEYEYMLNFVSHILCYCSEKTKWNTQPHPSRIKMKLNLFGRRLFAR
jgi:hypothetical protein